MAQYIPTTSSQHTQAPPPSYDEATAFGLKFKDFIPIDDSHEYFCSENITFSDLVAKANAWLSRHRNVSVKSCDSVVFKLRGTAIVLERMSWNVKYNDRRFSVRGLRLWYVEQPGYSHHAHQQIGYYTAIPNVGDRLDVDTWAEHGLFESCSNLVDRTNSSLRHTAIGDIINLEMFQVKVKSQGANPEDLFWSEAGHQARSMLSSWTFIYCLHIYYIITDTPRHNVQIGYRDFCPTSVSGSEGAEPFAILMDRARRWCAQKHPVRYTNVQTLTGMVKHNVLESECLYCDKRPKGYFPRTYARFVRLWYIEGLRAANEMTPSTVIVNAPILGYIDFIPERLPSNCGGDTQGMELLHQVVARLEAWVAYTGARIFSCETLPYKFENYLEDHKIVSECTVHECGAASVATNWFHVLRLYVDGVYGGVEDVPHLGPGRLPATDGDSDEDEQDDDDGGTCSIM